MDTQVESQVELDALCQFACPVLVCVCARTHTATSGLGRCPLICQRVEFTSAATLHPSGRQRHCIQWFLICFFFLHLWGKNCCNVWLSGYFHLHEILMRCNTCNFSFMLLLFLQCKVKAHTFSSTKRHSRTTTKKSKKPKCLCVLWIQPLPFHPPPWINCPVHEKMGRAKQYDCRKQTDKYYWSARAHRQLINECVSSPRKLWVQINSAERWGMSK